MSNPVVLQEEDQSDSAMSMDFELDDRSMAEIVEVARPLFKDRLEHKAKILEAEEEHIKQVAFDWQKNEHAQQAAEDEKRRTHQAAEDEKRRTHQAAADEKRRKQSTAVVTHLIEGRGKRVRALFEDEEEQLGNFMQQLILSSAKKKRRSPSRDLSGTTKPIPENAYKTPKKLFATAEAGYPKEDICPVPPKTEEGSSKRQKTSE